MHYYCKLNFSLTAELSLYVTQIVTTNYLTKIWGYNKKRKFKEEKK